MRQSVIKNNKPFIFKYFHSLFVDSSTKNINNRSFELKHRVRILLFSLNMFFFNLQSIGQGKSTTLKNLFWRAAKAVKKNLILTRTYFYDQAKDFLNYGEFMKSITKM